MKSKDNLLITWPGHCFLENIVPLLKELHLKYNIYYITVDFDIPDCVLNKLNELLKGRIIAKYYILPKYEHIFSHFKFLNKIKDLRDLNFTKWISMSNISIYEKYISENLIPNNCKKIILWTQITYLFENKLLTQKLLNNEHTFIHNNKIKNIDYSNILSKLITKLKKHGPLKLIILIFQNLKGKIIWIRKKLKYLLLENISKLLYFIYFKKKLNFGKYDKLTQLGSGEADIILFTDKKEVKAHKKLFSNTNIDLVQHTGRNFCNCDEKSKKNKVVLSPLSHPNNVDTMPKEELDMYLNAFKLAEKYADINEFHLRPHPREGGNWPNYLCDYLKKNYINAKVVDVSLPIYKIICNYAGVIGESSCVLRDASNSCQFCFVVGIEKLSLHRYENPKFVFGDGQNINWINKNGSYDPLIFKNKKNKYYDNTKKIYDFLN